MLNYVNRVLVGLSTGLDSNNDTLATLGRGDMLVLDSEMTPITAAPADNNGPRKSFYIAVGTGFSESPYILSSPIFGDNVTSYLGKTTRVAADQVSYVGWNGTSGDIGAVVDKDVYQLNVVFKDRLRLLANRQSRLPLVVEASGTDKFNLLEDFIAQSVFDSPYIDPYGIKIEVVSDGTDAVSDNNITVVNGSKDITFTTAATHSVGTLFAVDDYIAIDDILYKITAVNGLVITLSRAFSGVSGTVLAANVDHVSTISNYGLKFSGVSSPKNNADVDKYEKVSFEIGVSESFASAPVTYTTAADLGQGIARQIKEMEEEAQGYLGNTNRTSWPIPVFDYHSVDGVAYDVVQITHLDEHEGDLQGQMKSPVGTTIAFANAGANAQRDNIVPILDALIPGFVALNGAW